MNRLVEDSKKIEVLVDYQIWVFLLNGNYAIATRIQGVHICSL